MLNISKQFNSNYKLKVNMLFSNDSLFCNTSCLISKEFNDIDFDKTSNKFYLWFINKSHDDFIVSIFLKELIFGTGNLVIENINDINNLIIKSKNVINTFLWYNNQIKDLERRFSFNDNKIHSFCIKENCSICRKDLNICEYCYKNYYLEMGSCILNNDNSKFINNYSLLKNIDYEVNTYNKISPSLYEIDFNIPFFNTYFLINYSFHLENNSLNNIQLDLSISTSGCNHLDIYFTKLLALQSTFRITEAFNDYNCLKKYVIKNFNNIDGTNDLTNFSIKINKENINCNQGFKDITCEDGCSRDSNYLIKFDENHLFYSKCSNSNLDNYFKNDYIFLYYSRFPKNCKKCDFESNKLIYCTICHDGYILKNKECLLKLNINCKTENNFQISNENSRINLFICSNFCDFINNKNNEEAINLINYHTKIDKLCEINDNIILKCKNNTQYYNYFKNKCFQCINNNCFNSECNNCSDINNFTACSEGYINLQNKCILNKNYNINCGDYEIDNNNYICSICKTNFYLYKDKKCYIKNTNQCLKYKNNSHICDICNNGLYINNDDNICYTCRNNCVTCINNYDNCTSCEYNYWLINNKCIYNKIYSENCEIFNQKKECIKCNNGYNLNTNKCKKCIENCKSCNVRDNYCESCFIGYNLDLHLNTCIKLLKNCIEVNKNDAHNVQNVIVDIF